MFDENSAASPVLKFAGFELDRVKLRDTALYLDVREALTQAAGGMPMDPPAWEKVWSTPSFGFWRLRR